MLLDRLSALQPLLAQMDVVSNALTTVLEESQNWGQQKNANLNRTQVGTSLI